MIEGVDQRKAVNMGALTCQMPSNIKKYNYNDISQSVNIQLADVWDFF